MSDLLSTVQTTIDTSAVGPYLEERTSAIRDAIAQRMGAVTTMLMAKIKNDKLSGQLLNQRSSKLYNSVRVDDVQVTDAEIGGGVLAGGGPVNYARALEYGSKPHLIVAKNKKALAFQGSAQNAYAPWGGSFSAKSDTLDIIVKSVKHPGTREYAFMRGTLTEYSDTIKAEFQDAASEAAKA